MHVRPAEGFDGEQQAVHLVQLAAKRHCHFQLYLQVDVTEEEMHLVNPQPAPQPALP